MLKQIIGLFLLILCLVATVSAEKHVALIDMDMMILPGTQGHLQQSIKQAEATGAELLIVRLNTPGGMLNTSQEMIQDIFQAAIPVVIYVAPTGATATSAGVFITMAGHVAVMSPGTSIGAAHPVAGDGKDIEGDMRKKAENMTVAMVKSISEQRGRNVSWAEESVRDSSSLTSTDAVSKGVVDFMAEDLKELISKLIGKKVKIKNQEVELGDYQGLPIKEYELSLKNKVMNFVSDPNIAALLWLGATTGLSIELYSPGAILPGVVGVICLILALAVMQIIPFTQSGLILLIVGSLMVAAEMFVPSGVLAVGGVVAIVLGAIYLIDPATAPGLSVSLQMILPVAGFVLLLMLWVLREIVRTRLASKDTSVSGLIGETVTIDQDFFQRSSVFVNGEIWKAELKNTSPVPQLGDTYVVTGMKDGLILVLDQKK